MNEDKVTELSKDLYQRILSEFSKRIVGQKEVIEQILIALFSQGHVVVLGLPGLAKTLIVKTLAELLDIQFSRIQFTPDLMPSDITGSEILEEDPSTGKKYFKFVKGPIFANIILADEINRTPPKTQSALLEAMQELKITVSGKTYFLEKPFFVVATQNPIEQEGTYPLPEALLDRFMMEVKITYPSRKEEIEIVKETTGPEEITINKVISRNEILEIQKLIREIPAPDHVVEYAVDLVRKTRPSEKEAPDIVKEYVLYGASPRASQSLILGSKARAFLRGTIIPTTQDVKNLALPVLRHRIIRSFKAEVDNVGVEDIIKSLL
ncbi:MAG: MoxR family ATPase [bacterium]|nr:MoxR family ATPase [bacterium]